ncbi:MAG TPA: hypothetical protein VFG55_05060 [Rhodanobacteraceae bacterium]|nr:hypothetical protein [Rhodanobacteraceae bacterium]
MNPEMEGSEVAGKGLTPLRWTTGAHDENAGNLLKTAYFNTAKHAEKLGELRYNEDTGKYTDQDGNEFTRKDFERLSSNPASGAREARAGRRTLARKVFERSILQRVVQGAGPEVRDVALAGDAGSGGSVGRELNVPRAPDEDSALHKAYYSKTKETPANAGVSASGRGEPLTPETMRAATKKVFGSGRIWDRLTRAGTLEPITKAEAIKRGLGTEESLEGTKGLHHKGKGYLITDQIEPEEVPGTILHEIGVHHTMEAILGKKRFAGLQKARWKP